MTQINSELDTQIKIEKHHLEELIKSAKSGTKKAEYEKILVGLKHSKYLLLKNADNLNAEQLNQLVQVQNLSPILKVMHELKENIRKIFNKTEDWYTGVFKLGRWLLRAKKYFPNSNNTIIRWFPEISAYFEQRTTNGMVEGINHKIKLIQRSG